MKNFFYSFLDTPEIVQCSFQDPATSIMEGIIELHHTIFFFLIIITILVFWMLFKILLYYSFQFGEAMLQTHLWFQDGNYAPKKTYEYITTFYTFYLTQKNLKTQNINHNPILEIIWVILPAIVLIFIAIPSFTILYSMDEIFYAKLIVKVIGHQWYWSYEIPEHKYILSGKDIVKPLFVKKINATNFDSFLYADVDILTYKYVYGKYIFIPESLISKRMPMLVWRNLIILPLGVHRLLDTDLCLILPIQTHIQVLVTSDDVIHSWAIPSLGIKIDCVPGRLNQVSLFIKRPGIFYGQCSEICGINHGFMPIKIMAISFNKYKYFFDKILTPDDWYIIIATWYIKKTTSISI